MEGKIGAAAVLYQDGRRVKAIRHLLGKDMEHTVHEGELVGIALGLHLAKEARGPIARINISLDNQVAIQSVAQCSAKAGQHINATVRREITALRAEQERRELAESSDDALSDRVTSRMELMWLPGHEAAEGNEAADKEAKKAITEGTSSRDDLPGWLRHSLPANLSAVKQELKRITKTEARDRRRESRRFKRAAKIDETMPSGKYLALTDGLTRREAALLTQLLTGHTCLNGHVNRINRAETPWCPHCGERNYETLTHVLYICPKYL
ncbi:SubName: Full=Uncharacterized protein {ECO:0000313/EMBL:CCA76123.1} [Serendipita indica DSM 11827]|nr:SubName: Full=Uncharacterized protein {ECO:0000313/EMBL:CCA76123.1} [Serendipita indica DSM 11827]